ncbi:GntR family transcriptional regulator [Marinobacterium stanieri]|uniref:GntR family transcriptional regulator n=1 Tax=Marinobacterium stanieri TaxID=49186 RepID=UPI000255A674|nr:GntR family transcriptional regulator [Marinobacterium stanieri]
MKKISRKVLFEEVADALAHMIYSSELSPGEWIDELKLCKQMDISRTPLREALKVLASDGLVELVPRKGAFVKTISLQDLDEIFPIMAMLEGYCAQLSAEKATREDLHCLQELHSNLEHHAASADIPHYYEVNTQFHDALKRIARNGWLEQITLDLSRVVHLARHQQLIVKGRLNESIAEHRRIIEAIEAGDADQARQVMHVHLMNQYRALKESITKELQHGLDK